LLFAGLLHTLKDFDMMLLGGERELTSTANNQPEDYPIGVKLMGEGKVRAKPFITHVFSLDEYQKAFEVSLNKGKYGAIKVVMKPRGRIGPIALRTWLSRSGNPFLSRVALVYHGTRKA
ncbi:MAG: hypothetical protein ACP5SK_05045, partial [Thermoprotei archaeon]